MWAMFRIALELRNLKIGFNAWLFLSVKYLTAFENKAISKSGNTVTYYRELRTIQMILYFEGRIYAPPTSIPRTGIVL